MATTEELLAQLESNPEMYASDESQELVIDAETRTINIPASETLFGVKGDKNIERKYFRCPRIVGDNVDLSTHLIYIAYVYTDSNSGSIFPSIGIQPYHCDDVEIDGDNITFSWQLSDHVFQSAGFIAFKMYAKEKEDSPYTVFNTAPAIGTVLHTIDDGVESVVSEYPDIINQLLAEMENVEQIATPEAMQEYVNQYLTENPVEVPAGLPSGGTTGQILSKDSDSDFDASWKDAQLGMTEEEKQTLEQLKNTNYSEKVKKETFVDHAVEIEIDPDYARVNMNNLRYVSLSESTDGIKTSGSPYENDDFNKKLTEIITLPANEIIALWTTGSEINISVVDFTDFYKDGSAPTNKVVSLQQYGSEKYVTIVPTRENEPMKIRLEITCSIQNSIYIDMAFRGVSDDGSTIANDNIPNIVKTVVPFYDMFSNTHVSVYADAKRKYTYESSKLLYVPAHTRYYRGSVNGYLQNGKNIDLIRQTPEDNEAWNYVADHDDSYRWWEFNVDTYMYDRSTSPVSYPPSSFSTISYDQYLNKQYSEYEYQMNDKYIELLSGKLQSDNFRGRNCYVIADSLTDYTDWHRKMCEEMGMTIVDKAVAGKKMVTSGLTDAQSIPTSDKDAVIIYWLGVNDDLPDEGIDNTSTDQTNLYGAYNAVCDYLTTNFPDATVLFILMHKSALKGESQISKNAELEKIMTTKGFTCWNPYGEIEATYADGYKDGLHIGGVMADRVRQKVKMILKTM